MPESSSTHLVAGLAGFVVECRDVGVPSEVGQSVRERLVDTLGVAIAAQDLDTSRAVVDYVLEQAGRAEAQVIGQHRRVPAAQAALANGVLAHSLDYDDTHLPSVLHPSASVVPAALAMAEAEGVGGDRLVAAMAAGLEVCVRLGMAGYDPEARNSTFFENGQHATSICGAIGAAAAASSVIGLDAPEVAHAMGIAVSFASGVIEGNRTGGTVKRTHCGWAAHAGVTAAQLASRGFTGPPTVLEGSFGFFRAFLGGRYEPMWLRDDLGSVWEIPKIFIKPYPANHFTHAGIDAATTFRELGVRPEHIRSAELGVPTHCVRSIGEPIEVKQRPATSYQAQFSGPYTVAAALFGGSGLGVALEDFSDEKFTAEDRRALMSRIRVVADPECDAIFPDQFPAILRVTLADGHQLEERVLSTRGGPQRPLSVAEIRRKFTDNVSQHVTPEASQRLSSVIDDPMALADPAMLMTATERSPAAVPTGDGGA